MGTSGRISLRLRSVSSVVIAALLAAGISVAGFAGPAAADTAPADPKVPATVSTDPLPAPQINGVVWDQEIVGNTVYVAGNFTKARPTGVAAGVSEVPRTYLLAYDVNTGELLPWAPTLNAQVRSISASPDGSRLFVGGDFTTVNGETHNRVVAFNTADGSVAADWTARANATVYSVVATDSTVYLAGSFSSISANARPGGGAAVTTSTGAVLPWAPVITNGRVYDMVVSPDASKVVIGGAFTSLNGSDKPGYGLGMVDATTGTNITPFAANDLVRDAGTDSAVFSLTSDDDSFYGTGYVFGQGGNLENSFRASWKTGEIEWINDCHGDTYSIASIGGAIYTAGHAHYCGNIENGFPQTDSWTYNRAIAFTKTVEGTLLPDPYGYTNWGGKPAPAQLNWFPTINAGTFTGQSQGPWDVTGNSRYVLYGGEFTQVNYKQFQGLARFAVRSIAPNLDGPRLTGDAMGVKVASPAPGVVTVNWPANWDRDNETLTYQVIRDGKTGTPAYTTERSSRFYDRPQMNWVDTGLTPGSTHTYRLRVIDPTGNNAWGTTISVTVATDGTLSAYATKVLGDQPQDYWRLGDASGSTVKDATGRTDATKGTGVTLGKQGAITGDPDTAAQFNGSDSGRAVSQEKVWRDNSFSLEAWFKTGPGFSGGKIIGFGSGASGNSSSYDRQIYMNSSGKVMFGVYPKVERVLTSPTSYNDGQWHHVVGSLGPDGMQLFLDGRRVGADPSTTAGEQYWGYWHIGGDNSWGGTPRNFTGSIDEVAVYNQPLTAAQVLDHYTASGREAGPDLNPTAEFSSSAADRTVTFDASASTVPDGSIVSYTWNFGDGQTGTGVSATHEYAKAGTYTVTLTVTDNRGGTGSVKHTVAPVNANANPTAAFSSKVTWQSVAFDASASSDSDGSIASYAWDFGDGQTGTGATPTHDYAAPGDYAVTLTVTDDRGGQDAISQTVTAVAQPIVTDVARDEFERAVSGGWGRATVGGPWSASSAANSSVSDGRGVLTHTPGATRRATLNEVSVSSVTVSSDLSIDKVVTGNSMYGGLVLRSVGTDLYQARVRFQPDGALALQLLEGNGGGTLMANLNLKDKYAAGQQFTLKAQAIGTSPTVIRAKVWPTGTPEPTVWQLTATSSAASLQTAGQIGVLGYLSASATNGPVSLSYDSFRATQGDAQ